MPASPKKRVEPEQEKIELRAQIDAALSAFLSRGRSIEQVPARHVPDVPPLARDSTLVPDESPL